MDAFLVTGLGVVAASLIMVIRQRAPEHALLLSVAAGVLILGWVISAGKPFFEEIQRIMALCGGAESGYVEILFKAMGICFVAQIACDACRDMGESAIAAKVELAAKISVLVISLPLFEKILSIVGSLIQ